MSAVNSKLYRPFIINLYLFIKMAFKSCVYKNCDNYVMDGVACGDFTLFSFPKDPQRKKEWMQLSNAPACLPSTGYYICSEHFDKKYISVNAKRKLLVGLAKPFPYVPDESSSQVDNDERLKDIEITKSDENYVILNLDKTEAQISLDISEDESEHLEVGSTTIQGDELGSTKIEWEVDTEEVLSSQPKEYKRATNLDQNVGVSAKYKRTSLHGDIRLKNLDTINKTVHHKNSTKTIENTTPVIDTSKVTTFIFKGEEYVQMPKQYYIQEKQQMLDKLAQLVHYEHILREFKLKLNDLHLS